MSSLTGSSSNTNTTNNGQTSSTLSGATAGSSTPTFSPSLQALMNQLAGYSTQSMTNPSAQLQPIQNAGLDQINQAYSTAPQVAATQLASRGYGSSGAMGNTLYQAANAKAAAQSNFNGQIAGDAVQQGQFGATLANQLLNTGKGTSTSGTTSGTSSGTSSSAGTSDTTQTPSILSSLGSLAGMLLSGSGLGLFGGGGGGGGSPFAGSYPGDISNPDVPGSASSTITYPGIGGGSGGSDGGGDPGDDGQ